MQVKAARRPLSHSHPKNYQEPNNKSETMSITIETLMDEHRLIEQVLSSLATFAEGLEAGQNLPREAVARYGTFFKMFADKCHHGKEEERLFVQMNQCGFPREYGPIGVMLAEHDEGRRHVRALVEIGQQTGPLRLDEARQMVKHARAFIPLLLEHIRKEDNVLYPMALQSIPPATLAQLEESCRAYDSEVVGHDEIQRLKDLAQDLLAQYPPHPGVLESAHACSGCGCH
jgi:hemerythrin-like domain-containing protein